MSVRVKFLTVFLALVCTLPLFGGNIFLLPDGTTETAVYVYTPDPVSAAGSYTPGAARVVSIDAAPDGSKYYTVANTAMDTVVTTDGTFTVVSRSGQWNSPGRDGVLTPDGRYFLALAGILRVIDTATGNEVGTASVGSSPGSVAVSIDSRYALVLSSNSQRLYKVDLATFAVTGEMQVGGSSTAVAAGPNGYFYVSAQNRILVIDGGTLEEVGRISINGTPNKLYFTPDGGYGVATNTQPATNVSCWIFDLSNNSIAAIVPTLYLGGLTPIRMEPRVEVVSNGRFFMTSTQSKVIYEVTIPDGNLSLYEPAGAGGLPDDVRAIVKSSEMPEARYLFYLNGQALSRSALATDTLSGSPLATPYVGSGLMYAGPSSMGVPVSAIRYNDNQTIPPESGPFRPIVVRALDANGIPVYNATVDFAVPNGVTVIDPMDRTNRDGLAMAVIDPGAQVGPIPVTVTIGGTLTAMFNLQVGGGGGPGGGGLQIFSGQGQLVGDQYGFLLDPLTVQITDPQGNPVSGATVSWTITSGPGFLSATSSETGVDGKASIDFFPDLIDPGRSFEQSIITASWEGESVDFYLSVYRVLRLDGQFEAPPQVDLRRPTLADPEIVGRIGEVQEAAVELWVGAAAGTGGGGAIPNVAVTVDTGFEPDEGPYVECQGKFALTGEDGVARCNMVFGGQPGTTGLTIHVGGKFVMFPNFTVTVLPGEPAAVAPIQGDGQAGDPGAALPLPLIAEIRDAAGNPLAGQAVNWEVLPQGAATLSNVETTTNAGGRVSARVTLGNTPGTVQVRVSSGAASYTFNLTVNVTVSQLRMVSGDNQLVVIGETFPQPLVVELLDENGEGVPGQEVSFAVTSGSASLSSGTATTDGNGRASVTVTAGGTPGAITVEARYGGLPPVVFHLNSRVPGPALSPNSFVNGASGQPGIVPGSVVKIIGPGLAPGVENCVVPYAPVGGLPLELAGVQVFFGPDASPIPAPIYYVCNRNGEESVAIQAPWELTPGTVRAKVMVNSGETVVENIPVFAVQPGLFETVAPSGLRHAVVMRPDGSFVSPENPAERGEILALFATGLGPVSPPSSTNAAGLPGQQVQADLVVGVNNAGTRVIGGEYAVNMIGVYVVYFELPQNTTPGPNRPFALAVRTADNQLIFANGSAIFIR